MSSPDDFSDTDLSAWLDGELDAERRARRSKPGCASTPRTPRACACGPPTAMRCARAWTRCSASRCRRRCARWCWQPLAAPALGAGGVAAGLLLAGGADRRGGIWQWQGQRSAVASRGRWPARRPAGSSARRCAHSVYVPEPRHAVEVKAQEEHLARWLTRRIDMPVKLFDLRDEGFELVGGRLLPDAGGKSAQLMYERRAGPKQRVTVYLRKPDAGAPTAFRYAAAGRAGPVLLGRGRRRLRAGRRAAQGAAAGAGAGDLQAAAAADAAPRARAAR